MLNHWCVGALEEIEGDWEEVKPWGKEFTIDDTLERFAALSGLAGANQDVVSIVTPLNANDEKQRWLDKASSGDFSYIPKFEYDKESLRRIVDVANALGMFDIGIGRPEVSWGSCVGKQGHDLERVLRWHQMDDLRNNAGIAMGILEGNDWVTRKFAQQKFTLPDLSSSVYEIARKQADDLARGEGVLIDEPELDDEQIAALERMRFDASGIKYWFEWAIEQLMPGGFVCEGVEISESATSITVLDSVNYTAGVTRIVIPAGRKVSGRKLVSLVRHEIECHVLDIFRGFREFWIDNRLRCKDGLLAEGHAMLAEEQLALELFGSAPKYPKPWYALALEMAQMGAPAEEIAETIYQKRLAVEGGAEKALRLTWITLYRTLFRGRTQPEDNGYFFSKDFKYLEGYLIAKDLPNEWLSVCGGTLPVEAVKYVMSGRKVSVIDKQIAKQLAYRLLDEA